MQAAINVVSEADKLNKTIERIEATASDCSVEVSQWSKTNGGTHADAVLSGTFSHIGDLIGYMEQMGISSFSLNIVGGVYRPES